MKRVPVSSLNVKCSYKVRNLMEPNMAMSDCCQEPATFAVHDSKGNQLYRCYDHRWMIRGDWTGGSNSTFVNVKDD